MDTICNVRLLLLGATHKHHEHPNLSLPPLLIQMPHSQIWTSCTSQQFRWWQWARRCIGIQPSLVAITTDIITCTIGDAVVVDHSALLSIWWMQQLIQYSNSLHF